MKRYCTLVLALLLLCELHAFGLALYCWDTNGTSPGAGGSAPTGTWGEDPYWGKESWDGTVATEAWTAGNYAVFAAGNDATGAYTVYVSGVIDVGDIHVDLGDVTFDPKPSVGGSLKLGNLLSVGHKSDTTVARYNVPITDAASVVRYKWGTLIFGATNTFPGPLTIEGGIVECSVPDALSRTNRLVLANNDASRTDFSTAWQFTPAQFRTGGFSHHLGELGLLGTDVSVARILDLGKGAGTLWFEDSHTNDWSVFTLTITNYALGSSQLRFGTTSGGLTSAQLSQMQFADFANLPGTIDANGYVTPNLPRFQSVTPSSGTMELLWSSIAGKTYRVWSKESVTNTSWDFQADVVASGTTASYTDPSPNPNVRFYRLELLQ